MGEIKNLLGNLENYSLEELAKAVTEIGDHIIKRGLNGKPAKNRSGDRTPVYSSTFSEEIPVFSNEKMIPENTDVYGKVVGYGRFGDPIVMIPLEGLNGGYRVYIKYSPVELEYMDVVKLRIFRKYYKTSNHYGFGEVLNVWKEPLGVKLGDLIKKDS